MITQHDIPNGLLDVLGDTGSHRIDTLVHDLVEHSAQAGQIVQGTEAGGAMNLLREFMFEHVYLGPIATREHAKINTVISTLFDHYCEHPEELPPSIPKGPLAQRVTDQISGMTDRYSLAQFEALTVPVAFTP